jgi:hypothetical protein
VIEPDSFAFNGTGLAGLPRGGETVAAPMDLLVEQRGFERVIDLVDNDDPPSSLAGRQGRARQQTPAPANGDIEGGIGDPGMRPKRRTRALAAFRVRMRLSNRGPLLVRELMPEPAVTVRFKSYRPDASFGAISQTPRSSSGRADTGLAVVCRH